MLKINKLYYALCVPHKDREPECKKVVEYMYKMAALESEAGYRCSLTVDAAAAANVVSRYLLKLSYSPIDSLETG